MAQKVIDRLVSVKSIVTLTLTAVFSYLAIQHVINECGLSELVPVEYGGTSTKAE